MAALILLSIIVFSQILVDVGAFDSQRIICQHIAHADNPEYCGYDVRLIMAVKLIKLVNDFQGAVISFLTLSLCVSTHLMWKATKASIDLARAEFVTTHRARIIIRLVKPSLDDEKSNEYPVKFTCANIGDLPAEIVEVGSNVYRNTRPESQVNGDTFFNIDNAVFSLAPGESKVAFTKKVYPAMGEAQPDDSVFHWWCAGYIKYRSGKSETIYQTGFCRRWNDEAFRWELVPNDDWEYAF